MTSSTTFLTGQVAGLTVSVHPEVTQGSVVKGFDEEILTFQNTFDKRFLGLPPEELEQDAQELEQSINDLIVLSRDGIRQKIDPNDPNSSESTYYLTQEMARRLDELFNTLEAVGATIDASSGTPVVELNGETVRRWLDFSLVSPIVEDVLDLVTRSTKNATRTLQAMIELDYVRTGNELLEEKMLELEESLTVTKDVTDTLGSVQDLHNQVGIIGAGFFEFDYLTDVSNIDRGDYKSDYIAAAEDFFGVPINPEALVFSIFPDEAPDQSIGDLIVRGEELLEDLNAQIEILSDVAPGSDILERVTTVRDELEIAVKEPEVFLLWLTDNFGTPQPEPRDVAISEISGRVQENINFAISSSQAFNDSQKEEVRRFLFVFEEYYKSASALLTKINQIIEKIAQNIAR